MKTHRFGESNQGAPLAGLSANQAASFFATLCRARQPAPRLRLIVAVGSLTNARRCRSAESRRWWARESDVIGERLETCRLTNTYGSVLLWVDIPIPVLGYVGCNRSAHVIKVEPFVLVVEDVVSVATKFGSNLGVLRLRVHAPENFEVIIANGTRDVIKDAVCVGGWDLSSHFLLERREMPLIFRPAARSALGASHRQPLQIRWRS